MPEWEALAVVLRGAAKDAEAKGWPTCALKLNAAAASIEWYVKRSQAWETDSTESLVTTSLLASLSRMGESPSAPPSSDAGSSIGQPEPSGSDHE